MKNAEYRSRPAVLLDLDNTILDFDWAERRAISRTLDTLGVSYDDDVLRLYNRINIRHWEMLEKGILTREQVLVRRFAALYAEIGADCSPEETQKLYEQLLGEGHRFLPGAEAMLKELADRYCLFMCSNGTASVQAGRIESAGIAPYFEKIFVSEHMGCNKPSREYFELCFAEIPELDRQRTVMVGDSLTSDIQGGVNAGIRTVWYNPAAKPLTGPAVPDHEIRALEELSPLLAEIFGE